MSKPGDPIWVDLFTTDADRAIAFYGDVFDWTAERAPEFGNYITFRKDGKVVAGGMENDGSTDGPDQWTVYLASTDAKATADQAAAHGGFVVLPVQDVGDLGRFAILGDAGGAGVGIWEPGTMGGFEARGNVADGRWSDHIGAPSWFELHTPAYDTSLEFYRDVFGWQDPFTIADTPEFRYTTIHSTSPMLGGVIDTTPHEPGSPAYWTVYFGVDDVDAAAAKIVDLGGSIVVPAADTPYGRLAAVTDPGGVRFSIGGNNKS